MTRIVEESRAVPSRYRTSGLLVLALAVVVVLAASTAACGGVDSTPEKLDGADSYEFEPADIERANDASDAVQEYCSGAVSEAQEVGCLSHVDEDDLP